MTLHRDVTDGVMTLTLDDGKRNALDIETFQAIIDGFDSADDEVQTIVLAGREGALSAGLNLKWMMQASRDQVRELLVIFGQAIMRIWTEPRPTVCAATGHAVAGGTMLAMACDHAVAADGEYAWGLTETQIDFELPDFAVLLTSHNVRRDRLEDLLLPGLKVDARTAVEVGFADELQPLDQVVARAQAVAAERGALPGRAYAGSKQRMRGRAAERILEGLEADVEALTAHMPS